MNHDDLNQVSWKVKSETTPLQNTCANSLHNFDGVVHIALFTCWIYGGSFTGEVVMFKLSPWDGLAQLMCASKLFCEFFFWASSLFVGN